MNKSPNPKGLTYDFVCFSELAYEFEESDIQETEKKIKRRLKYYSLGSFNPDRVDYLRTLRNDIYNEITKHNQSKYFLKSTHQYSDLNDFDLERLQKDFSSNYPSINGNDMQSIINLSIYLFYLR